MHRCMRCLAHRPTGCAPSLLSLARVAVLDLATCMPLALHRHGAALQYLELEQDVYHRNDTFIQFMLPSVLRSAAARRGLARTAAVHATGVPAPPRPCVLRAGGSPA